MLSTGPAALLNRSGARGERPDMVHEIPEPWWPCSAGTRVRRITLRSEPYYRLIISAFLVLFRLLRLEVRIQGGEYIPAEGPAVIAATHFGYLEFAFLGAATWWQRRRLVRFLATQAAFRHPVSGPFMRRMGHVPVDRAAGRDAYQEALDALRRGELLGVFPEGGVSRSWQLGPFKSGAVRLAAQAQVPIIPVVVWGSHRIVTNGHRFRLRHALRVPVTIVIGPPVTVSRSQPAWQATEELRAVMEHMLVGAQEHYPDCPRDERERWWLPARLGGSAPAGSSADPSGWAGPVH